MAKICVMGDYDSICGFNALGIDTFSVTEAQRAETMIANLAGSGYCIILITENLAQQISAVLEQYRTEPTPALIPIPSVKGSNGMGMAMLRRAVEQAVGSADMIFGSDK